MTKSGTLFLDEFAGRDPQDPGGPRARREPDQHLPARPGDRHRDVQSQRDRASGFRDRLACDAPTTLCGFGESRPDHVKASGGTPATPAQSLRIPAAACGSSAASSWAAAALSRPGGNLQIVRVKRRRFIANFASRRTHDEARVTRSTAPARALVSSSTAPGRPRSSSWRRGRASAAASSRSAWTDRRRRRPPRPGQVAAAPVPTWRWSRAPDAVSRGSQCS